MPTVLVTGTSTGIGAACVTQRHEFSGSKTPIKVALIEPGEV